MFYILDSTGVCYELSVPLHVVVFETRAHLWSFRLLSVVRAESRLCSAALGVGYRGVSRAQCKLLGSYLSFKYNNVVTEDGSDLVQ